MTSLSPKSLLLKKQHHQTRKLKSFWGKVGSKDISNF